MNLKDYARNNWEKIAVLFVALACFFGIFTMVLNLREESESFHLQSSILDKESLPVLVEREHYEKLHKNVKSPEIYLNLHKRNIFSKNSEKVNEINQVEIVDDRKNYDTISERLVVRKVYKKPVKLLFKGYMKLADDSFVVTINWAGKTDFKKIGEEIRRHKVVDIKRNVVEKKTLWGGTENIDMSEVVLEDTSGEKITLKIGHITLGKEVFAEIFDRKLANSYNVHVGSVILEHKILDIFSKEVIMLTPDGDKLQLKREQT